MLIIRWVIFYLDLNYNSCTISTSSTYINNKMRIKIDINLSTPLFNQLMDQIKKAVMDGLLKAGDPLPSIRQLANDLELNHNTVAKAYRLLERDSVIQTKGYRGTSIHADAIENSTVNMNDSITTKLNETIKSLRESGATDSEIRIAFNNVMKNH
jgi:GntR family transcriptional regulator